jgi:hypothetical protein
MTEGNCSSFVASFLEDLVHSNGVASNVLVDIMIRLFSFSVLSTPTLQHALYSSSNPVGLGLGPFGTASSQL